MSSLPLSSHPGNERFPRILHADFLSVSLAGIDSPSMLLSFAAKDATKLGAGGPQLQAATPDPLRTTRFARKKQGAGQTIHHISHGELGLAPCACSTFRYHFPRVPMSRPHCGRFRMSGREAARACFLKMLQRSGSALRDEKPCPEGPHS